MALSAHSTEQTPHPVSAKALVELILRADTRYWTKNTLKLSNAISNSRAVRSVAGLARAVFMIMCNANGRPGRRAMGDI